MKINRKVVKIICFALALVLFATLCACSENKIPNEKNPDDNSNRESDSFTLLIYMCGSSLESKNGAGSEDISELLCADIRENVNIVIQTGGARRWKQFGIAYDKIERYTVTDGELKLLDRQKLSPMSDEATLREFVDWGTEQFPSERTALILWDHGGGFLEGICMDELFRDDWLTMSEFDQALGKSTFERKFEFIGFDCCLMANYETALIVSKYTDKMIASECDEPVGGWDYKAVAESVGKNDFYDVVLNSFEALHSGGREYTLSTIDLTKLDAVSNLLGTCIEKAKRSDNDLDFSGATEYCKEIEIGTYLYDLGDLAKYFGVECNFDGVITTVQSKETSKSGMSVCCPLNDENALEEYLKLTDSNFGDYLAAQKDK